MGGRVKERASKSGSSESGVREWFFEVDGGLVVVWNWVGLDMEENQRMGWTLGVFPWSDQWADQVFAFSSDTLL